jgi:glycosyltransferase involved in cell wall biosynthesis
MLSKENLRWLNEFFAQKGRAPRILHIGNIANNAYMNAKLLRRHGIESDVLCYDYYHIMGCPEWEDAEFDSEGIDHFNPDWQKAGVRNFARPDWYFQGPLLGCLERLANKGASPSAELPRENLRVAESFFALALGKLKVPVAFLISASRRLARAVSAGDVGEKLARTIEQRSRRHGALIHAGALLVSAAAIGAMAFFELPIRLLLAVYRALRRRRKVIQPINTSDPCWTSVNSRLSRIDAALAARVTESDISLYSGYSRHWGEVFRHYDLVQGYSTDGVFAMLLGKPYVAYEHGTIRNVPFQDTPVGRICAATYKLADCSVITNCDNLVAARRLKLRKFRFVPHPINEDGVDMSAAGVAAARQQLLGGDRTNPFIVFHPARHSWSDARHPDWEKGNDLIIRGFASFVASTRSNARLVLIDWGDGVPASKELIAQLGVADLVSWMGPKPHRQFVPLMVAADVVIDQISVGSFGSLLAKALMCGKPSLVWLKKEVHEECFAELPPIMNVTNVEDVSVALTRLNSDLEFRNNLGAESRRWYETHHSNVVVANGLISVYREILAGT